MKVKYLPDEHIETAAFNLLVAYGQKFGAITAPPVPVEEILEAYLELNFELDDLTVVLEQSGVLGATWIQDKKVIIDSSLDPTYQPGKEGRYRFTVAHEIGHWVLHKYQLEDQGTPLFESATQPAIVCRVQSKREPIEWQADAFAGHLLMPKEMVLAAWETHQGSLEPYIAVGEMADKSARWGLAEDSRPTVEIARQLAKLFRVSGQAMQIRLIGLGLIKTEVPEPDLFSN